VTVSFIVAVSFIVTVSFIVAVSFIVIAVFTLIFSDHLPLIAYLPEPYCTSPKRKKYMLWYYLGSWVEISKQQ
jgi:hypothetical protein